MKAFKCDICGSYFDYNKNSSRKYIVKKAASMVSCYTVESRTEMDICDDCYEKVFSMLDVDEAKRRTEAANDCTRVKRDT